MTLEKAIETFTTAGISDSEQVVRILFEATTLDDLERTLQREGLGASSADQFSSHRLKNVFKVDKQALNRFVDLAKERFRDYAGEVPPQVIELYVSNGGGIDSALSIGMRQELGDLPGKKGEQQSTVFKKLDEFLYSELRRYLFPEQFPNA